MIQNDLQKDPKKFQDFSYISSNPEEIAFENLPNFSWFIELKIQLEEPFLSRGDDPFYPFENSVCRDAASGLPTIKSTTWKGNFIDAAYRLCCSQLSELAKYDWAEKETRLVYHNRTDFLSAELIT